MKVGSLFSGIGVFDLAAERCGMEVCWQVEIDRFANRVLAKHWPDVERHTDARTVDPAGLRGIDLLAAGWPCQDHSTAGLGAGLAGERSGLFYEVVRFARVLRPGWILLENVPGLRSSWSPTEPAPEPFPGAEWEVEESSDFESVLRALVELGYCGAWRSLDAQWFDVAQRRERLFFVFGLGASRLAALLPFLASGQRDPAPRRRPGQDLARDVAPGLDASFGRLQGSSGQDLNHGHGHLIAHVAAPLKAEHPGRRNGGSDPIAGEFVVEQATAEGARVARPLRAQAQLAHREDADTLVVAPLADSGAGTARTGNERTETEMLVASADGARHQKGGFTDPVNDGIVVVQSSEYGAGVYDTAPNLRADRQSCGEYAVFAIQDGAGGRGGGQNAVGVTADGPCYTLDERCYHAVAHSLRPAGCDASEDGTGRGTPLVAVGDCPMVDATIGQRMRGQDNSCADNLQQVGSLVRRLSPTECERLMGVSWLEGGEWQDGHTCLCGRNRGRSWPPEVACTCPDGPRYRGLGNAVVLSVVEWVLRHIAQAEVWAGVVAATGGEHNG